ncbi:MAG: cupin domain-containing protein [Paracoccus sp. (in: a-proteobacteria)]|nr:cupin domain-containing protein [Paracoccus sp. (in: a-proteobacteria)]
MLHRIDAALHRRPRQADAAPDLRDAESRAGLKQREDAPVGSSRLDRHGDDMKANADHAQEARAAALRLTGGAKTETDMQKITPADFTAARAWDARDIARLTGTTTIRLHWTDQSYRWHVNDGAEVFVVLDGAVDMHMRDATGARVLPLATGDIFYAEAGCEHKADPRGIARVLVIEREGSV